MTTARYDYGWTKPTEDSYYLSHSQFWTSLYVCQEVTSSDR